MDKFNFPKTLLDNINEQNDRINECIGIVNGYTTDEETRVAQELQRQQNEELRQEQYNNNENRFAEINTQMDTKAKQSDLIVERNRIDSFTRLGEGSTTGDAELIDGRNGADGNVYNNIGSAIRGQYSILHDNIYSFNQNEIVTLSNVSLTDGKAIHSSGKTYSSAAASCCEFYINIDIYKKIQAVIVNTYSANYFIGYYDIEKTFISRLTLNKVGTFDLEVPTNTKFIRFSLPIEAKNEFRLIATTGLKILLDNMLNQPSVKLIKYIDNFNDLKLSCEDNLISTIVLCTNIVAAEDITEGITVSGNKHIVGNGYSITGNSSIQYLLTIANDTCIIDDLIISDANYNVICCNGGVTVLRNCEVYNSFNNDGVGVHGNADVFIYDSKIHDCRDEGLSSHGNSYCEIYNTRVYRNGWELGTDTPSNLSFGGLHLGGSRMGIIANCRAYKNTSHGISFITIDNDYSADAKCICYNNLTYDNDEAGICFGGATNIVCSNNASANNASGIRFTKKVGHGNNGIVFGNSCFNNTTNYSIWTGANEGLIFDTTI